MHNWGPKRKGEVSRKKLLVRTDGTVTVPVELMQGDNSIALTAARKGSTSIERRY